MRKHFIVLFVLFIAGLFFNAINNGNLKACGTKTAACKSILKNDFKSAETDHLEEADPSLFLLVNPLIY
ncbi:MAG: hypothetical protein IPH68_08445 [Chitinophagaceae bacterium]|nr:hypothetical protein [Chitinophagaceae bacterium]MBK7122831.1 hypothetical protein [Chitinophagaceae bacterium]MBK7559594.1 hypothetical protein [Chitinophagaceae bacterium]MBK9531191.1 hypothetical protein [Chitinophagaceae bacterium]HQW92200.1 hypothetical protein [Ferruginibacter sp.]